MTQNGQGAPAGAAAIVTALADAGTRLVFGLPGGGPSLDVVGAAAQAGLRFVLAHTETAAVIMAATYADLTGRPGAALVTRGPGLASAVNGIAHAALDRLPVVVIADTVRRADAGRISHQRLNHAALGAAVAKAVVTIGRDLIKIKQRPAGQGGPEAVDFGPVSYARAAQALGAAAVTVSTETDLAAALSAASGRDGPMVIDVQVDPAGYPAIMELSRGEAGRAATIAQQL